MQLTVIASYGTLLSCKMIIMAALKNKLILQGAPLYNRWSSVRSNVNALAFRQFSFLILGRIWWQIVYILVSSYLMKQ